MNCAKCGHVKHRVMQTRRVEPDLILRQRICRECAYHWFTMEMEMPEGAVKWGTYGLVVADGYKRVHFS